MSSCDLKATAADVSAIADLRVAVADRLTKDFGHGHWSSHTNDAAVLRDLKASHVLVARDRGKIIATLTLQTKKPWAIDLAYFTPCKKALYLINMAVHPRRQRRGIGRALMTEAARVAREHCGPTRFASMPTMRPPEPVSSTGDAATGNAARRRIAACLWCTLSA